MYKINILIHNKHGELVDRQLGFKTLDEMRNLNVNELVNDAEKYAEENNMLLEEIFDSKEEAEFNKEDTF